MRIALYIVAICCTLAVSVHGLAVMSVDLGSEWMKVGIVSPGVPMEIALNKESKRKTSAVLSFRDNIRLFGEDAQTVGVRFPKNAYQYVLDLVGKKVDHPLVKLYQKRFPYYEIIEDPVRGTVLFKHDDKTVYSPEELLAQMLVKAKEFAEAGAHQVIKECVLTVPGFFNQIERKAILQAAELANLKVLQLINDYTAIALNYGIFRTKTFNETAQYVLFYDMGASSTAATLVSYQNVKVKDRGYVETHPQLSVLGVGFDRTLGGLEIQIRLRDYLAKKFNEQKKTKSDVFKNPRAMAKLFKEAGKLKNILSANNEYHAQVEGLLDDIDFKQLVSREDLENLVQDLFGRVTAPIEQALKSAHLTLDVVSQIVLVGAGTRVPKIQAILQQHVKQELAKNINTDEAATMGAVYKAADLSTGFQVKKFITKDAVLYPIHVTFDREVDGGVKHVRRTLFGLMNPYPQKKIITFNKYTSDFTFNVNYAELDYLPKNELLNIGSQNISEYKLTGVENVIKKNTGDNIEPKGIKAHFLMDESGVLRLINVEYVVEKTVTEDEGTFSKLGSTISKLFGGEDKKEETGDDATKEQAEESEPIKEDAETPKEKAGDAQEKQEEPAEKTKDETAGKLNETESKNATEKAKDNKPKIVTVKDPIDTEDVPLSILPLNEEQFAASLDKISKLNKIEYDINRRASALNNLESFVIDVQNKAYEDEYSSAITEEELEKIKKACSEVSDWLYEDGAEADADTYESKLKELTELTRDWFSRVWEHRERPDVINALNGMLNHSTHFLATAKNMTKANPEKDVFTDAEVDSLDNLITEITEWRDKQIGEQKKLQKYEEVKLTVRLVTEKMGALDREVKYLVNKIKYWRPKNVEKPTDKKKDKNDTKEESEKTIEPEAEETLEEPEAKENDDSIDATPTDKDSESSHSEL